VTEKIEQKIKDIEGLKKMSSTSSIGVSSIILEFDNGVDMSKALVDVKDAVDKVSLPSEAQDPFVTEISTDNERMFDIVLYGNDQQFSQQYIKEKARKIKYSLEGK
jgi:multidrug efflux pump subunit AcrB